MHKFHIDEDTAWVVNAVKAINATKQQNTCNGFYKALFCPEGRILGEHLN